MRRFILTTLLAIILIGSGSAITFFIKYDQEIKSMQKKLDVEQGRVSDSQVTITKQIEDLDKQNAKEKKLINDLIVLKGKFDILSQELRNAEQQIGNSSFLSSRIIGNGIRADIDSLLSKSGALNNSHRVAQTRYIKIQTAELRKLQNSLNSVVEEKEHLSEELAKISKQLAQLQQENNQLRGENEAQNELINYLRHSLDSLSTDLSNKSMAYDRLADDAKKKDDALGALKTKLGQAEKEKQQLQALADSIGIELISERAIVSRLAENSLEARYKMKRGRKEYNVKLDQDGKHKRNKVKRIDIRFHVSHSMIDQPNNELVKVEILDNQYNPVSASLQKEIVINDYRGSTHFDLSKGNRLRGGNYYIKISHNSKKLFFYAFRIQ
ncbi:MAG: hypothetical protein AAGG75_10730 [Bacteroidota bacterium]